MTIGCVIDHAVVCDPASEIGSYHVDDDPWLQASGETCRMGVNKYLREKRSLLLLLDFESLPMLRPASSVGARQAV